MDNLRFEIVVDTQLSRELVEKAFDDTFLPAMRGAVLFLESKAAGIAPVGVSGNFRSGITSHVVSPILGQVGVTGIASAYSPFVELGREAGKWPPIKPIMLWVKRVIRPDDKDLASITFLVRRKIGTRGVEGHFVFKRTAEVWQRNVEAQFVDAAEKFARLLS